MYALWNQGQICGPWGSGCSAQFCLVPPCRTPSWWVSWVWRGPKDCRKERINASYRSINGKWWEIAMDMGIYAYLWYITGKWCGEGYGNGEIAVDIYGSISAFGQRFSCLSWICSLFFHWFIQEKRGHLLGIYCFIPPKLWVTQVKPGNHKGFKWFK